MIYAIVNCSGLQLPHFFCSCWTLYHTTKLYLNHFNKYGIARLQHSWLWHSLRLVMVNFALICETLIKDVISWDRVKAPQHISPNCIWWINVCCTTAAAARYSSIVPLKKDLGFFPFSLLELPLVILLKLSDSFRKKLLERRETVDLEMSMIVISFQLLLEFQINSKSVATGSKSGDECDRWWLGSSCAGVPDRLKVSCNWKCHCWSCWKCHCWSCLLSFWLLLGFQMDSKIDRN